MSDQVASKPLSVWQGPQGDFSMMRLIAFIGTLLGVLVVLTGLFVAVIEVIDKRSSSIGLGLVTVGFGLFTSGALTKAWQSQAENKGA